MWPLRGAVLVVKRTQAHHSTRSLRQRANVASATREDGESAQRMRLGSNVLGEGATRCGRYPSRGCSREPRREGMSRSRAPPVPRVSYPGGSDIACLRPRQQIGTERPSAASCDTHGARHSEPPDGERAEQSERGDGEVPGRVMVQWSWIKSCSQRLTLPEPGSLAVRKKFRTRTRIVPNTVRSRSPTALGCPAPAASGRPGGPRSETSTTTAGAVEKFEGRPASGSHVSACKPPGYGLIRRAEASFNADYRLEPAQLPRRLVSDVLTLLTPVCWRAARPLPTRTSSRQYAPASPRA